MKTFSFLSLAAVAALTIAPLSTAHAGHRRGNCCCGNVVYAAPAAASPAAAAATTTAPAVAQNQAGYRAYSYQPGAAAPVMTYRSSSYRRSNQPMWMNGGNKSLGNYK